MESEETILFFFLKIFLQIKNQMRQMKLNEIGANAVIFVTFAKDFCQEVRRRSQYFAVELHCQVAQEDQ